MTKLKKVYCMISFAFAIVAVMILVLSPFSSTTVYATGNEPADITVFTQTDDGGNVTKATEDSTDGLSITYRNNSGSLTTPVKMFFIQIIRHNEDVLGIDCDCIGAIYFDNAYVLHADYCCITFYQNCDGYTNNSTKSGYDWVGFVFDIFYYVAYDAGN